MTNDTSKKDEKNDTSKAHIEKPREFWILGEPDLDAVVFTDATPKAIHVIEKSSVMETIQFLESCVEQYKNHRSRREVELQAQLDEAQGYVEFQDKKIIALQAQCEKLAAALEWYRDGMVWNDDFGNEKECARKALAEYQKFKTKGVQ